MRRSPSYFLLLIAAALAPAAWAALGGNVDFVANSQSQARVQLRQAPSNGYTIHELTTESGVNLREYATAQGVVFAVAWNGPLLPNLEQLLGNYFPIFNAAAKARRSAGIRGPVVLQQDDLVVQSGGHMRAYRGRAYVPSLVPPQVAIDEIR